MLGSFVWFENSRIAINISHVRGFKVTDNGELHFWIFQGAGDEDGWGYIITNAEDIRSFLTNVAKIENLPKSLEIPDEDTL